jgi:hypothetical protein
VSVGGGRSSGFSSSRPPRPSTSGWVTRPRYVAPAYGGPSYYVAPTYVGGGEFAPPPPNDETSELPPYAEAPARLHAALEGNAGVATDATLLGGRALFEGERIGFTLGYTGILSPATDGSEATDVFHLADAHLTYSLLNVPRGRIRAEFGAHLAVAPDVTFFAPGVGVSAAWRLLGAWGLETRIFGNVWPYSQLDARLGLTWGNRWITLSGGGRALYLNDNGALGVANAGDTSDFFIGPYVGLAFSS